MAENPIGCCTVPRPVLIPKRSRTLFKLALISQKTKLAEAIRYALSRWNGLTYFLDDGRIDRFQCRQTHIRPIALNSEECPLRRLRWGSRTLGGRRITDREQTVVRGQLQLELLERRTAFPRIARTVRAASGLCIRASRQQRAVLSLAQKQDTRVATH